jgi:agmatine/peptidylarginine deiminase
LFTIAWSFTWTYCILQIIDKTIGLRVTEEDEEEGLDSSIHNEKLAGNNVRVPTYYDRNNKITIATLKAKSISVEAIVT